MTAEFYRPVSLAHLFDWIGPVWHKINCLFVRLDSNPNLINIEKHLSPRLRQANVVFSWKPEGLWISGSDLSKSPVSEQILVPFSACYIFDDQTMHCDQPAFSLTTDYERPFNSSELNAVSAEVCRLHALGYAADGCGLQWLTSNEEMYSLIRRGYISWLKAIENQAKRDTPQ